MSTMSGDQSNLSSFIAMFALMAAVFLVAIMLLGSGLGEASKVQVQAVQQSLPVQASAAAVPNWLNGRQTGIEPGLIVSPHAAKHAAEALDAQRIYEMLLQGKCAAAAQFCNSDGRRLYLCLDPVSGLLGGLFIQDGVIESGWGSRASYWAAKVRGDSAPFKPDKCYRH